MIIPTLTTERLTLRAPRTTDFETYAAFRSDTQRMRWLGGATGRAASWVHFAALSGQWLLRGYGRWIVTEIGDDTPCGLVGLYHPDSWSGPELSWAMFGSAEGRGYAQEASEAARRYAYEKAGITCLVSHIHAGNDRSNALARRLGATPAGTFDSEAFGALIIWRHPGPADLAGESQ